MLKLPLGEYNGEPCVATSRCKCGPWLPAIDLRSPREVGRSGRSMGVVALRRGDGMTPPGDEQELGRRRWTPSSSPWPSLPLPPAAAPCTVRSELRSRLGVLELCGETTMPSMFSLDSDRPSSGSGETLKGWWRRPPPPPLRRGLAPSSPAADRLEERAPPLLRVLLLASSKSAVSACGTAASALAALCADRSRRSGESRA